MEGMKPVSTRARAFERGEPVGFVDVPGFVVLLDAGMKRSFLDRRLGSLGS